MPPYTQTRAVNAGLSQLQVVSFRVLKARVRIAGCWHQPPRLIVVGEGVSLDGAWHRGRVAGPGGSEEPGSCWHRQRHSPVGTAIRSDAEKHM